MFSHEEFVLQQSGHDLTWRIIKRLDMSRLYRKQNLIYKIKKNLLTSEYHLKDQVVLSRLREDTNFCSTNLSPPFANPGGRDTRGPDPHLIFRPNWGLKDRKKLFWDRPPYLRVWMTAPLPPAPRLGLDTPLPTRYWLISKLLAFIVVRPGIIITLQGFFS